MAKEADKTVTTNEVTLELTPEVTPEVKTPIRKIVDVTKQKVRVRLERNRPGEENFVFVGVNHKNNQVKRGMDVQVPFAVAEALRMAEDARQKQYAYEEQMEKRGQSF